MNRLETIKHQIDSLTVFSDIKNDTVIRKLRDMISSAQKGDTDETIKSYSAFLSSLYPHTSDLTDYIRSLIIQNENFYVKAKASKKDISCEIISAAEHELDVLSDISSIKPEDITDALAYDGFMPLWTVSLCDFKKVFHEKLDNISKNGYGIFAKYSFFRLNNDGKITPVTHPDCQSIDSLYGYKRERDLIIKNTKALISGSGASNMLLYGDAGTGKSSTIKAVASHFADEGLRLIEVKKNQLYHIPQVMEDLSSNPLKFILFIDDLSFNGNDDNFSALKATLEGSISGRSNNVAIYATSNRRHLVKENMSDRDGDELHVNDTIQETLSLAARFGLTITFQKPDKDSYLSIVKSLADQYGIDMDEDELYRKAEAHALRSNGRSPRTAKQFIELLKIGI